jgi:hypothetical protein
VIGICATERSTAIAPATGEDPAAAFSVTTVELHEVVTSLADIDRMRIDGRAASAAIGRVVGWTGVDNRTRNRD